MVSQKEERAKAIRELVEDVEHQVANGIRGEELVIQLKTNKGALYRRLLRAGRLDLAHAVECPKRPYKKLGNND